MLDSLQESVQLQETFGVLKVQTLCATPSRVEIHHGSLTKISPNSTQTSSFEVAGEDRKQFG